MYAPACRTEAEPLEQAERVGWLQCGDSGVYAESGRLALRRNRALEEFPELTLSADCENRELASRLEAQMRNARLEKRTTRDLQLRDISKRNNTVWPAAVSDVARGKRKQAPPRISVQISMNGFTHARPVRTPSFARS